MQVHILVLAAGESSRLGRPKQLLPYGESSLIQHVVQEAIGSNLGPVEVVLGAYSDQIIPEIENLNCNYRIHHNWEEGLSSSIAFGVRALDKEDLNGVIMVLGDQVHLERGVLLSMMKEARENIVICKYKEGAGPPCYFDKKFFNELSELKGDDGAKTVVAKHRSLVKYIPFDKGHIDIDTQEDLKFMKD